MKSIFVSDFKYSRIYSPFCAGLHYKLVILILSFFIVSIFKATAFQFDYYGNQYSNYGSNPQCTKSQINWNTIKNGLKKPPKYQNGYSGICLMSGYSCCPERMKGEMPDTSYAHLENILFQRLGLWMDHFRNDSLRLYDYYQSNINESADNLNLMFSNTYGYNYKVNKDFFDKFFLSLKEYMSGNRQNIKSILDDFWNELLKRIVRITEYAIGNQDMARVDCIVDLLINKHPFRAPKSEGEGVPAKIEKMVMKAFPQARIFDNALAIGAEVLESILEKKDLVSKQCIIYHARLKYCHLCYGLHALQPCAGYCLNIINGCFADMLTALSTPWTAFIDALERVLQRLNMPYNFPNVNHPLKLIVSEGIMNLQARLTHTKQENYRRCGAPAGINKLTRRKRQLYSSSMMPTDYFTPYVRDAIGKYRQIRNLFSDMARDVCSTIMYSYRPNNDLNLCWNGTRAGQYTRPVVDLYNISNNPEFRNLQPKPMLFSNQVRRLQLITRRLLETLEERDPDFVTPLKSNWSAGSFNRSAELVYFSKRRSRNDDIDDDGGGSGDYPIYNQPEFNSGGFYLNPENPRVDNGRNINSNFQPGTNRDSQNNFNTGKNNLPGGNRPPNNYLPAGNRPNNNYLPGGNRPNNNYLPGGNRPPNPWPIDPGSGVGPQPGVYNPPIDDADMVNPNSEFNNNNGGTKKPEGSGSFPPYGGYNSQIGDFIQPRRDDNGQDNNRGRLPPDQETGFESSGGISTDNPSISELPWKPPIKPVFPPKENPPSKFPAATPTTTKTKISVGTKPKPGELTPGGGGASDLFNEAPPNIWIPEKASGLRSPSDLTTPSSANQNSLNYIVVLILSGLYAALLLV